MNINKLFNLSEFGNDYDDWSDDDFPDDWDDENIDSKNDQIKKIYENIRDFPSENKIRIKADQNDLYRVQNELKSLGYTIKDINEKIGVNFKGPLYRGYKMDQNSFKKLEALVGREIKKDLEVGYSPDFKRIRIDHKILKDVCDELNKIGYSNNKISKEIGTYIGNALYKDYSIDNLSFKKLEELYGKEIPHESFKNKPKALELMEKTPSIKEITYEQGEKKKANIPENSIELKESQKLAEFKRGLSINGKNEIDDLKQKLQKYEKKGKEITHDIIKDNPVELKENSQLAEMVGIILGDGNLYIGKGHYRLRVSSNRTEETEYRKHTKQLMTQIFKIIPNEYDRKGKNATDLVIQNKAIINNLVEKGLKTGNKVLNCVSVPDWIKQKDEFKISCLRGLIDTDGSIYLRNTQKSIGINFKNSSLPLVKDFKSMCDSLGIKTQDIPKPKISHDPKTGKSYRGYQVTIENKFEVTKFLYVVKPKKWDYNARNIGMVLLTFSDPTKREAIKKNLDMKYLDKKIHYTEEYANFLKSLCESQGYVVCNDNIIRAIKIALENKTKTRNRLNTYGLKLIEELKEKLNYF